MNIPNFIVQQTARFKYWVLDKWWGLMDYLFLVDDGTSQNIPDFPGICSVCEGRGGDSNGICPCEYSRHRKCSECRPDALCTCDDVLNYSSFCRKILRDIVKDLDLPSRLMDGSDLLSCREWHPSICLKCPPDNRCTCVAGPEWVVPNGATMSCPSCRFSAVLAIEMGSGTTHWMSCRRCGWSGASWTIDVSVALYPKKQCRDMLDRITCGELNRWIVVPSGWRMLYCPPPEPQVVNVIMSYDPTTRAFTITGRFEG